jgi:hypothetical protein
VLEEKVMELYIVDKAVDEYRRASFQKAFSKLRLKEQWVIPPTASSALAAAIEDVLEVYRCPHDPDFQLCLRGRVLSTA